MRLIDIVPTNHFAAIDFAGITTLGAIMNRNKALYSDVRQRILRECIETIHVWDVYAGFAKLDKSQPINIFMVMPRNLAAVNVNVQFPAFRSSYNFVVMIDSFKVRYGEEAAMQLIIETGVIEGSLPLPRTAWVEFMMESCKIATFTFKAADHCSSLIAKGGFVEPNINI